MSQYPSNDPSIPDSATLLRRIPVWEMRNKGGDLVLTDQGEPIPTSNAFRNWKETDRFSVFVAEKLVEAGLPIEAALEGNDEVALAQFSVGLVRAQGRGVVMSPHDRSAAGVAHADVVGQGDPRADKLVRKAFARAATWARLPPSIN